MRSCDEKITRVSGHNIFESLFRPISRSLNRHFLFTSQIVSLMTFMISRFMVRMGLLSGMPTDCRTKHGPIRWSPPQQCPLLSLPLHPLHLEPIDCSAATHKDNPPVHRRLAASG